MTNQRLKKAMAVAHMTVENVAEEVKVDPKTVRRWLDGQVPYPKHRWSTAALLGEDEEYIWPPAERLADGTTATDEIVDAYAHRALKPPGEWRSLLLAAKRNIDLLGYAMLHLPEQHPDLMNLLRTKGDDGCEVRIALADPDSEEARYRDAEEKLDNGLIARIRTATRYFSDVEGAHGVEIRHHATPMYNSIFRFDDEMFVTPHLYGIPGSKAPLLHLRRRGGSGLFESFMLHFQAVWESATLKG